MFWLELLGKNSLERDCFLSVEFCWYLLVMRSKFCVPLNTWAESIVALRCNYRIDRLSSLFNCSFAYLDLWISWWSNSWNEFWFWSCAINEGNKNFILKCNLYTELKSLEIVTVKLNGSDFSWRHCVDFSHIRSSWPITY